MATVSVGPEWTNLSGKVAYGVGGNRDVLFIVSEDDLAHPDVVQRRPAIELTQEVREKLENQRITKEDQGDDLTIMKARESLDKRNTLHGVEMGQPGGEKLTRESVLKHITTLMNNNDDRGGGVVLYYIGHGKRNTGDWCFEDGFITFRDLTHLYLQLLRGRVMTIVTDCSYSGCWIKECMTFLDQQGVGPCGHSARDKGILIKVLASCLSHQVPRQLSFSVYRCGNDKNTGDLIFNSKTADAQHIWRIDSTLVRCGQDSIQEECLCLPQANWQTWSVRQRIRTVKGSDRESKAWHMLLIVDDDETILRFAEQIQTSQIYVVEDYGEVLKSGKGEWPTKEEEQSVMNNYQIYKNKPEPKE